MADIHLFQCHIVFMFFLILVPIGLAKRVNTRKILNERIDSLEQFMRFGMDLERRTRERESAEILERLTSIEAGVNSTFNSLVINDHVEENEPHTVSLKTINDKLKAKLIPFVKGIADIKRRVKKDVAEMNKYVVTWKLHNNAVEAKMAEYIRKVDTLYTLMPRDPEYCEMSRLQKQLDDIREDMATINNKVASWFPTKRDDISDMIDNKIEKFRSLYDEMLDGSTSKKNKTLSNAASCLELKGKSRSVSGVHDIFPPYIPSGLRVYCDQETDGGGWTVFQRRMDGSVNFHEMNWEQYKKGFGDPEGEYWIGNEYLSLLTRNEKVFELRVDMDDFDDVKKYAVYDNFKVFPESEQFKLQIGSYSGDAGDSLIYHNNMKFSTKYKDNDLSDWTSCADTYKGGWWYKNCHKVNINGKYQRGEEAKSDGVSWSGFRGFHYSLKHVEMKFR